jgi:alpha-mannosidase
MQVYGRNGDKDVFMSLINDNKYGHEVIGGDIRLTIVRSPLHSDGGVSLRNHEDFPEFTDHGLHEFTYGIIPGVHSQSRAGVVRLAQELNTPPQHIIETYHEGPLAQHYKGISVSAGNVIVTALKESEDGQAFVLRCFETCGDARTDVCVDIPLLGRKLEFTAGRYDIRTFMLPKDALLPAREVNLIEM